MSTRLSIRQAWNPGVGLIAPSKAEAIIQVRMLLSQDARIPALPLQLRSHPALRRLIGTMGPLDIGCRIMAMCLASCCINSWTSVQPSALQRWLSNHTTRVLFLKLGMQCKPRHGTRMQATRPTYGPTRLQDT